MIRKKMRSPSESTKAKLRLIDEYAEKTGDDSGNLIKVARWVHAQGMLPPPPYDPIKLIAKSLANACRQDYVEDENREPVRRRHAYIPKADPDQKTFSWFKIEEATPEKMRLSAQGRRNGTLQDMLQLVRDINFYKQKLQPWRSNRS